MLTRLILLGVTLFLSLLSVHSADATVWAWMSAEQYLRESTLIAVLDLGKIHKATTPEGIMVESTVAVVEKVIWYQHASSDALPGMVIVYGVHPNAGFINPLMPLKSGRVLAMLRMTGAHKFVPYDRLSIQPIKDDSTVMWPTHSPLTHEVALVKVIDELNRLILKVQSK